MDRGNRRERRKPDAIRRKNARRAPRSLEEIERSRNIRFDDDEIDYKESFLDKLKDKVNRKKKRKNTFRRIRKGIAIVLSLFIVYLIGSVATFLFKIDNKNTIEATPVSGESVNILVLGLDIGDVNNTNDESIKRTDTIMLVNYNKSTKATQIVSIPRDTLVTENGKNYKINAAFQKGGDKKVKSVVENMLSVTINYIVKINYDAFRGVIDALGGIDMEIERDMVYDDDGQNLHINFKKGTTEHLDGKKAEEFFRWRKNNDGTGFANGDLDRIDNQHKFIQKVVDKCKSPSIIYRFPKILNSIAENMNTNMSSFSIINYGLRFVIHAGNIQMKTIKGTPKMIGGQSYVVYNKKDNNDLMSSLASGVADDTQTKSEKKVLILNGTKISGLASRAKAALEVLGWSRIDTKNADSSYDKSVILTDDSKIKKLLKSDLGDIGKYESKPSDAKYNGYDVVIIIGNDYKKLGE